MTILRLVWKSLRQHALSSAITATSIALATGLWLAVWVMKTQSESTFTSVDAGFDAVLGARGSKLQLVLNAIFHLEDPVGNLAYSDFEEIRKNSAVELAVPLAFGDNYRGYRIVGTEPDLFLKTEYRPGHHYEFEPGGRIFDGQRREALIGSFVAQRLHLRVGDKFQPYHGLIFNAEDQHAETYVVVGILKPSNTPADKVLWIPLAGIQTMAGHDPRTATDVSAVLVKLKSAMVGRNLDLLYNKQGNRLTFAWPIARVMAQLFDKIAWFERILTLVAYLVALVAAASVLASIYNSMNERRREIAILRALGARRHTVFGTIVLEAAAISAGGALLGLAIYAILMSVAAGLVRAQTGVVLNPFAWTPVFLQAPLAMIGLGAAAGIVPAIKAYRTDVADNLVPIS